MSRIKRNLIVETVYRNDIDMESIKGVIYGTSKYIKYTGNDEFALVDYKIEPCTSNYSIIMENCAELPSDIEPYEGLEKDFNLYFDSVKEGVKEAVDFYYNEYNKKIGGIKITVLKLLIHPSDSRKSSYKMCGIKIIYENFKRE